MDENNDGTLTEEEFLKGCLQVSIILRQQFYDHYMNFLTLSNFDQDDELSKMLAPNVST